MIAAALALLAGAFFGMVPHLQRMALPQTDVRTGAAITVASMAVLFWIFAPFVVEPGWWGTQAALIFAACGLVFPAFSQTLSLKAVEYVGPNLASAIGSCAPLFAAIFAIGFLGEALGLQGAAGMALLMGGLAIAALGPGKGIPRSFPLWALLLPLGASFFRGGVQAASKVGFSELPSPYFATLLMVTVSTFVLGAPLLRRKARAKMRQSRRGNLIFVLNGLVSGGGILTLNAAISTGAVTVAAPLASTAPLWTFLYAALFFQTEKLTWRLLAVALVVVAGAVLIVTR